MSPHGVTFALGYFLFIQDKSQFGGTRVNETGDFIQGVPRASVASQVEGEAFPLGKATEVTHGLD